MNKRWQEWDSKWEQLSLRERVLLLLVMAVLPLVLIFIFLVEPAIKVLQKVPAEIEVLESSVQSQKGVLEMLQGQEAKDPNIKARQELKLLRQRLLEDKAAIKRAATQLVGADDMLKTLRTVLTAEKGVALISARNLPIEERQLGQPKSEESDADASRAASAVLYVHPVELILEGSYQGLYNYLLKLEGLDDQFFWDVLQYDVEEYPQARIRLQVHTLSSDAGWLGA